MNWFINQMVSRQLVAGQLQNKSLINQTKKLSKMEQKATIFVFVQTQKTCETMIGLHKITTCTHFADRCLRIALKSNFGAPDTPQMSPKKPYRNWGKRFRWLFVPLAASTGVKWSQFGPILGSNCNYLDLIFDPLGWFPHILISFLAK